MAELSDLVQPETQEEIEESLLGLAEENELPTTSWGPGSWILTVFKIFAAVLADAWYAVAQIANGGSLELATGRWLDRWAANYDDARKDPVFAIGTMRLVDAGGGPHVIAAGALVVSTSAGLQFRNITGGTLTLNGTLDLSFRAVAAGGQYNISNNTPLTLVTSLSGVSASNPAVGTTGTWISTLGADQESDDLLRARLKTKFPTLATGSPAAAYENKAKAIAGVSRVKVDDGNPDGPGTVRVYVDASSSVATLQASLDAWRPVGTKATAVAATTQSVTIPGTVTVARASRATSEAEVTANLTELAGRIPIGGKVYKAQVIEAVMSALPDDDNKSNFELGSSFSADVTLAASAIPQFTNSLVFVEV